MRKWAKRGFVFVVIGRTVGKGNTLEQSKKVSFGPKLGMFKSLAIIVPFILFLLLVIFHSAIQNWPIN